jgi:hypothetical protein
VSRGIIGSLFAGRQSAAFFFENSANCVKSRRNFRIPVRVSQVVMLGDGEFSLILLNFAFRRQLLREARPLLETSVTILRLS